MNYIQKKILKKWYRLDQYEKKLYSYEGYIEDSIFEWKKLSGLSWKITIKILRALTIFSATDIRTMLRTLYQNNQHIFNGGNVYITSFGEAGKSGYLMLYHLTHAIPEIKKYVVESWQIGGLQTGSKIIFVDDLIGTGEQSSDYINKKLSLLLKPTFDCYLLCLCATESGLHKVSQETNFNVIPAKLLYESETEMLSEKNEVFSKKEKSVLCEKNSRIASKSDEYNKGLLLAFSHCVPNNTMPIIWKEGFKYIDKDGNEKKWKAILPRKF